MRVISRIVLAERSTARSPHAHRIQNLLRSQPSKDFILRGCIMEPKYFF